MGTVVGTVEDCRDMFDVSAQTRIDNPVAYKLVRVAGDGRPVPATDEEILEVNETDMHSASDASQTFNHLPTEGSTSEGFLRSDNVEPSTDQVNSHPEYSEELLQKIEQDERLVMTHESHMLSTPPDANIKFCNENNMFDEDQVHHEPLPFSSDAQNGCDVNQSNTPEPCSDAASSPKETALPPAASQKPDFSLVRGEICLNNLPIKALQETFRATFGRETTVKDKTWLKRRITMGLTKSCDVPTTNLTIKDNKLVRNQDKYNDVVDVRATNLKDAPYGSRADQVNGHSNASGHSLIEEFSSEERAAKRVRKPTRRYIEELSETDDKSVFPSKDHRLSEKSEVRSMSVSSGKRVTRVVPLGGSEVEVPYVSHVRRSRPRENIMALMDCHTSCLEAKVSAGGEGNLLNSDIVNQDSVVNSASGPIQKEFVTSHSNNNEADQDMEPELVDSSGNSSDDFNNTGAPMMQVGGIRRKHHRAWNLSEVTQLVEGVSKYGAGKWSEIKKLSFSSYSHRSSVDLKDKWRNLLRASFAQSPSNNMGSFKKHGSMHIPMEILLQVRELAEKQSLVPPNHR